RAKMERAAYISNIRLAHARWEAGDIARMEEMLRDAGPPELRGWEWGYLNHLLRCDLQTIPAHTQGVTALAISPDGFRLASGSDDKMVKVWDAATGRELRTFSHKGQVRAVAFSSESRRLAVAYGAHGEPGEVRIWDLTDRKNKEIFTLNMHTKAVRAVAFSPDGRYLATASNDETVRLWNAAEGTEASVLRGHKTAVLALAFSPDSQKLASAGEDRTVRLWTLPEGKEPVTLAGHTQAVTGVMWNKDGKRLATASQDGTA